MLRSSSSPSPRDRLARLRVLWDDLTPSFWGAPSCGWSSHARPAGLRRASRVPWLCSSCVPRPMTPAKSPGPDPLRSLLVGFRLYETVALRVLYALEAACSFGAVRSPLRPTGCLVYASHVSFDGVCLARLRALVISSTCATLSTGGWSGLADRGVALLCRPDGDFHPVSKARLSPGAP